MFGFKKTSRVVAPTEPMLESQKVRKQIDEYIDEYVMLAAHLSMLRELHILMLGEPSTPGGIFLDTENRMKYLALCISSVTGADPDQAAENHLSLI
jgi:hypothetical protein